MFSAKTPRTEYRFYSCQLSTEPIVAALRCRAKARRGFRFQRGKHCAGFCLLSAPPPHFSRSDSGTWRDSFVFRKSWQSGFDIVYAPHIVSIASLQGKGDVQWRAHLDIIPDSQYLSKLFEEFWSWLHERKEAIQRSGRKIHVIIASELERSTTEYPQAWCEFARSMKKQLQHMRLADLSDLAFTSTGTRSIGP